MTRIAENQLSRRLLVDLSRNREQVNKYAQEISTGYKVTDPGDSKFSGTIATYREIMERLKGDKSRINATRGLLDFQDNAVSQANDLMVRAKELATQAANETLGPEVRRQMAGEVFEIRATLISLANSKYQDRYVFAGADDDDAPFGAATYTNPATGPASERWVYDDTTTEPANAQTRSVQLTQDVTIETNVPGNTIFSNALSALERLGRALSGYRTTPTVPDPGAGTAYTLPAETAEQTRDIQNALNLLNQAREENIMPARVTLGAKLRRLDSAEALLELTEVDAEKTLSDLQYADVAESATNLSQAQSALEASFTVTTRMLRLTILDYI